MKKKALFLLLIVSGLLAKTHTIAQEVEPYVRITHNEGNNLVEDFFSIEDGVMKILNNDLLFIYSKRPELNRTYEFHMVSKIQFMEQSITSVEFLKENSVVAFIDKDMLLHLSSDKSLGKISVWTITGVNIANIDSKETSASIPLPKADQGIYIIRLTDQTIKLIKQ